MECGVPPGRLHAINRDLPANPSPGPVSSVHTIKSDSDLSDHRPYYDPYVVQWIQLEFRVLEIWIKKL